jgi:hypothetical protein
LRKSVKKIREQWEKRKGRIILEVQLQNFDNINENRNSDVENTIFLENNELDLHLPDIQNLPDSTLELEREDILNLSV